MGQKRLGEQRRKFVKCVRFEPQAMATIQFWANSLGVTSARLIHDAAIARIAELQSQQSKTPAA